MFSQGAKDFIALHGGSANVFAASAANTTTDPMTHATPTNPPAANGDCYQKHSKYAAATALGTK